MRTVFTHSLIDRLHAGVLALPEYLTQVEMRYQELEPQIRAFVPEQDRSRRLFADGDVENLGGDIGLKELHNKRITLGVFPWKFKGGEAAFCRAVAWA